MGSCQLEFYALYAAFMIYSRSQVYDVFKINQFLHLRKYATHLFTTPLSFVIFDNMMSRLILTLTKTIF